jgi:hypothetical protein
MKPDYANSVVYKIVCLDPTITDLYVGSTTNLTVRKYQHKTRCNSLSDPKSNYFVYRFIRDNGGFDNWEFVVVRRYNNIKTKEELLRKERKYMVKLQATLNKTTPLQTPAEYYVKNKEKILEQVKEYRLENLEKITERRKEYYQKNKTEILKDRKEYRDNNKGKIKERNQQYRELHHEEKRERDRLYREANREVLRLKKREKKQCECGCWVTRSGFSEHKKTEKHKQLMEDK